MADRKTPYLAGSEDEGLTNKDILAHAEKVAAHNQTHQGWRDKVFLWETFGPPARHALWMCCVAALDDVSALNGLTYASQEDRNTEEGVIERLAEDEVYTNILREAFAFTGGSEDFLQRVAELKVDTSRDPVEAMRKLTGQYSALWYKTDAAGVEGLLDPESGPVDKDR